MIWMEIIGAHPERAGHYLICPIHAPTKPNYPRYRVIQEVSVGDRVFHCLLGKATRGETSIVSHSIVAAPPQIQEQKDAMCDHLPPYRKVELKNNAKLARPIPISALQPFRVEIQAIDSAFGSSRAPFDKNFRLKQLYLTRIPAGYLPILAHLSQTPL